MKKSNVTTGLIYILIGVALLLAAIFLDTRLGSILCGLSGALIAPGILMVYRYYYWSAPEHQAQYQERIDNEAIELHDERKEKLRDKSGRQVYILNIYIIVISLVAFTILGQLDLIPNYKLIILYLGAFLTFQLIAGHIIYKNLSKTF